MPNEQHAELNAWIAEKVMGWRFTNRNPSVSKYEAVCCWIRPGGEDWQEERLPAFTTSPADAMAVLEKCAEKCGQVKVNHPNVTASGLWFVSDMDNDARAKGYTLAYAICLFARQLFTEEKR